MRGKEFDALVDAVVEGTYAAERLDEATLELVVREARRRQKARVTGDRPRKRPRVIGPGDLRAQAVFMEPGLAHEDVLADAWLLTSLCLMLRSCLKDLPGPLGSKELMLLMSSTCAVVALLVMLLPTKHAEMFGGRFISRMHSPMRGLMANYWG